MDMKSPLRRYREKVGQSLDDLAAAFRVDKSTISRWETGWTLVPVNRLAEIEKQTGIPREDLRPDVFESAQ